MYMYIEGNSIHDILGMVSSTYESSERTSIYYSHLRGFIVQRASEATLSATTSLGDEETGQRCYYTRHLGTR